MLYAVLDQVVDEYAPVVATLPLLDVLGGLERGFEKYAVDIELRRNLRDVSDHVTRVVERANAFRALLQNALILFAPTLVGTVYGMNFDDMPELHWTYGYPMAVALMVILGYVLYRIFKHRRWL